MIFHPWINKHKDSLCRNYKTISAPRTVALDVMDYAARVQTPASVPIMSSAADFPLVQDPINNHTEPLIVMITDFFKLKWAWTTFHVRKKSLMWFTHWPARRGGRAPALPRLGLTFYVLLFQLQSQTRLSPLGCVLTLWEWKSVMLPDNVRFAVVTLTCFCSLVFWVRVYVFRNDVCTERLFALYTSQAMKFFSWFHFLFNCRIL